MAKEKATKSTKTTQSAPAKKVVKKTSPKTTAMVQPMKVESSKSEAASMTKTPMQSVKVKKRYIVWGVVIVILGALLYFGRSLFVAAVVNGQPISRLDVVSQTEKQSGKTVLDSLVRNALIEQEARKKNVTVSDKEIDDEIKKVEATLAKQGQKLDQVLQTQGMDKTELRKLIKLDKLVSKIVSKDVSVTDKEVAEYIEKNKSSIPEGQSEDQVKKSVKENLQQQKLSQKVQAWLADLQTKAHIIKFVDY